MSCTDAPVRPLTDFPELLRLAADLLTDRPARPRTLQSAADCGVVPGSDAELLLAQLVFRAPDGPDASNDALTRAGLALGLRALAEQSQAEIERLATVDRQGVELGDLRKRRDAPSHPPALLGSLRLAGIEPNGTLLESCELAVQALLVARTEVEDAQATVAMFRRRCDRLQAWFALPPDQRHPLGPEFTPDLEPKQTDPLDKPLWDALSADLSGRPLSALIAHSLDRATRKFGRWDQTPEDVHKLVGVAVDDAALVARAFAELRRCGYAGVDSPERDEDGYLLCTHCRRERLAGRKAVQGCGDCRWLNSGEREDTLGLQPERELLLSPSTGQFAIRDPQTGEVVPVAPPEPCVVGETERGPVTPGRVIHSGAELAAWLREDGGPDDLARAVLGAGGLEVLPASDPAICKALGLPPQTLGVELDGAVQTCGHTAARVSGKRVPDGAGNRPTEACSACGFWRVMGPGELWRPAYEVFPAGSV